jgi:hypothetical protein
MGTTMLLVLFLLVVSWFQLHSQKESQLASAHIQLVKVSLADIFYVIACTYSHPRPLVGNSVVQFPPATQA